MAPLNTNVNYTCPSGCYRPIRSVASIEVSRAVLDKTTELGKRILDDLQVMPLTQYLEGLGVAILLIVTGGALTFFTGGGALAIAYGYGLIFGGSAICLHDKPVRKEEILAARINFLVDECMKRDPHTCDDNIVTYVVNQWHLFEPHTCYQHTK